MRVFGLIGYPLSHSFSPSYFSEKFTREKITDSTYSLFPIKNINEFVGLVQNTPNLVGLNVTIPYKEQVLPFLTELDEISKSIGAVNCIKVISSTDAETKEKKILKGYNTDVFGFSQSIQPFLETHHQRALILGTGGASKAVEYVLKKIGLETYTVSRAKSQSKAKQFTYSDLNKNMLDSFTLIVNCTPLGKSPDIHEFPPIPYEYIGNKHFLYDLIYNPSETAFLKMGKQKGCLTMNGLNMLHLQADKAWEIWNQ